MKKIIIYTDGACSGNPGPGGWGALLICNGIEKEIFGSEENTTNNRMELQAAISSIEILKEKCIVELYTDSQYVRKGITQWIHNWVQNNWKNSTKKDVKNKDLWQKLLELAKYHEITWNWVEGHAGNVFNERVDKIAREACSNNQS